MTKEKDPWTNLTTSVYRAPYKGTVDFSKVKVFGGTTGEWPLLPGYDAPVSRKNPIRVAMHQTMQKLVVTGVVTLEEGFTEECDISEVVVGDVITHYEFTQGKLRGFAAIPDGGFKVTEVKNGSVYGPDSSNPKVNRAKLQYDGVFSSYKVRVIPWDRMAPAEPTIVAKDDRWNGTCSRCGKGTYQGAWKLEHDGGPCRG